MSDIFLYCCFIFGTELKAYCFAGICLSLFPKAEVAGRHDHALLLCVCRGFNLSSSCLHTYPPSRLPVYIVIQIILRPDLIVQPRLIWILFSAEIAGTHHRVWQSWVSVMACIGFLSGAGGHNERVGIADISRENQDGCEQPATSHFTCLRCCSLQMSLCTFSWSYSVFKRSVGIDSYFFLACEHIFEQC